MFKLIFFKNISISLYSNLFPLEPFSWSQLYAAMYEKLIVLRLCIFLFSKGEGTVAPPTSHTNTNIISKFRIYNAMENVCTMIFGFIQQCMLNDKYSPTGKDLQIFLHGELYWNYFTY